MKKIGIIGGLGPEATVDYYNEIINTFKSRKADLHYPEMIIYSVNLGLFIGLMKENRYDEATRLLAEKIESLRLAGAEFAAISANTPHILFDGIRELSKLPLISIVEATCREAKKRGFKRSGLFGTGFTMNATFYQEAFEKEGMEVIMPDEDDKEVVDHRLFSEIELGIFKDETREILINIIRKMVREKKIDSLILGCTEFPLILTEAEYAGIPMLNTTRIHVRAILEYAQA